MMFQPEHIEQIRSGEKTQTRRDWAENYAGPSVGSVVMATPANLGPIVSHQECNCYIEITRRWREPLGALSTRAADREGGYSVAQFKELWAELNGEWNPEQEVEVLEFEYVGRERPDRELQTTLTDGGRINGDDL